MLTAGLFMVTLMITQARRDADMPLPEGSRYTSPNRHNVRLTDGRIVTRAQAENIYAESRGFRNNYERKVSFRGMKEARRYDADFRDARQNLERRGRTITRQQYNDARARLQAEYIRNGNSWRDVDKSPDGPLAKYLEETGRRSERAEYDVGESPSIR
jgi:hypothetical protein